MRKYQEQKNTCVQFSSRKSYKVGMNAKIPIFQKIEIHEGMAFSRHNISIHLLSLELIM